MDSLAVEQEPDVLRVGNSLSLTVLIHKLFQLSASLDFEENLVVVLRLARKDYLRSHFQVDDLGVGVGSSSLGV